MGKTAANKEYVVERIVGHVSYEVAYQEYYKENNKSYEKMFVNLKGKKKIKTSEIHYLIKWLNWDDDGMTWEPEENCLDISYFTKYKILNGLKLQHEQISGIVNFDKYQPLKMSTFSNDSNDNDSNNLSDYEYFISDVDYNAKYGIVKKTKMINTLIYKKYCCIEKSMNFLKDRERLLLQENQKQKLMEFILESDSSYLADIISHPNMVKLHDLFYEKTSETEIKLTYIYEHCDKQLVDLMGKDLPPCKVVDLAHDMLRAFLLLHTYGVHANLSLRSIYYHDGKFKIGDMENFVLQTEINDIDKIKRKNIVYAPRRYGLDGPFEYTVDYHAFGLIILQCLSGSIEQNIYSPEELKTAIDEKMRNIPMVARHFIQLCIQARDFIYRYNLPRQRFTIERLLYHPFLNRNIPNDVQMMTVYFMYSEEAVPIKEIVYYTNLTTVDNVLDQLSKLYISDYSRRMYERLIMLVLKGPATQICPFDIAVGSDNFQDVVLRDQTNKDIVVKRITRQLPQRKTLHAVLRGSETEDQQFTQMVRTEDDPTRIEMHPERYHIIEIMKTYPIDYGYYDFLLDDPRPSWLPAEYPPLP